MNRQNVESCGYNPADKGGCFTCLSYLGEVAPSTYGCACPCLGGKDELMPPADMLVHGCHHHRLDPAKYLLWRSHRSE